MHLCPHESDIIIKDIVHKLDHIALTKHLMTLIGQAIDYFKKNELIKFDAQVGENLCQIRAYKIYLLSHSKCDKFNDDLQKTSEIITTSIEKLHSAEQEYRYWLTRNKSDRPSHVKDPLHLSDFFAALGVIVDFSTNIFFIYLCYFLCKHCIVDNENIPYGINYHQVQTELNLSKSFAKKIVHYYQKNLSELSCQFIFELLQDIPKHEALYSILQLLHKKSDEGRVVLPCFLVTKIIVQHLIQHEHNILLVCNLALENVHKPIVMDFKGCKIIKKFQMSAINRDEHDRNMIIFYGQSQYNNINSLLLKISDIGLNKIFLYNNAAHPQFSGKILRDFRSDPFSELLSCELTHLTPTEVFILKMLSFKIQNYTNKANILGCTKDNDRLFLLKHIFCDSVNKYY